MTSSFHSLAGYPRCRSPVMSIITRPDDEMSLKADIDAANAQQRAALVRDSEFHLRSRTTSSTVYTNRSKKSISSAVRGGVNSAKRFLRARTKSRQNRSHRDDSLVARCDHQPTIHESSAAELGSEDQQSSVIPAQLPDTQVSTQALSSPRISLLPPYECPQDTDQDQPPSTFTPEVKNLSCSTIACDSCRQPIGGKDFYDFCPSCEPSDRILCITCASQGNCWRHEAERTLASAEIHLSRSSPAPSYCNDSRLSGDDGDVKQALASHLTAGASNLGDRLGMVSEAPASPRKSVPAATMTGLRVDELLKQQHELLTSIRTLLKQRAQEPHPQGPRKSTLRERETTLRDQQTAIREERITLREQSMLLREQESLSRERDAMIIRNLLTFQELAKGCIGAQFNASKAEMAADELANTPIHRSKSAASDISLQSRAADNLYTPELSRVVAEAEASVHPAIKENEGKVKESTNQKRKKGGNNASSSSSANSQTSSKGHSMDHLHRDTADGGHEEQDDDDTDDSLPPKKPRSNPPEADPSQRIFACPYAKKDPWRYSSRNVHEKNYRNCSGHYLADIPRLKQHLKRVHWQPDNHCPRCFDVFKDGPAVMEHISRPVACRVRDCPFPEKMDKQQIKRVHVKRPKMQPVELWFDIFKTLFPGTPLPDSPYMEEEIFPTQSPVTASSAANDDAKRLVSQIFNTRLDQYLGKPGHEWLSSTELRKFIDEELSHSMTELFRQMPLTPTSSPWPRTKEAHSKEVSPVSPLPTIKTTSTDLPYGLVSRPTGSYVIEDGCIKNADQTPLLKPPKRRLGPALQPPADLASSSNVCCDVRGQASACSQPAALDQSMGNASVPDMLSPQVPLAMSHPRRTLELHRRTSGSSAVEVNLGVSWPTHVPVADDSGWDNECQSFQLGDDQHIMGVMQERPQPHYQQNDADKTQTSSSARPRSKPNSKSGPRKTSFIPVSVKTLEPAPLQSTTLKASNSPVDSGYGSIGSQHPVSKEPYHSSDADYDMPDLETDPLDPKFFEESFSMWELAGQHS